MSCLVREQLKNHLYAITCFQGAPHLAHLRDLGAFTVNRDGVLLVSDQAHGTEGFHETLLRHHGRFIRAPQRPEWQPDPSFAEWHGREVFKGFARHHTTADR
jgi:hypothetical protein